MRLSIVCILLLFYLPLTAQDDAMIDSSYATNHYLHRVQLFHSLTPQKHSIVFLGNSITEAGAWQELIPGKPVCNRGISGDVTYGVLARLNEVAALQPAKLFLLIGVNDLKRGIPIDTIAFNYERIVAVIKKSCPQTMIYVQSILPVNEALLTTSYKKLTNEKVKTLNAKLKAIASAYYATYVNLHALLADENGQLFKGFTIDGIHLWPDSYVKWVEYLKDQHYL